ncbi:hypothetical protein BO70DRAFT_378000 [Aspergillus heteromorphus CBS 117.55]|uniref:Uncharacterized protein n=1 Tax=Aspergillus heteromorphus CBS 117.55 TaxID=1448321 RepID=A0A317WQ19_9EURO|nr:uncharacterized protein BO70DRAFT_378000 [Aspergillus heteromorphus CBS 117.55]PWY88529.1 hypothetical protein BO70DRAFT_378000 [Aspergillus heteromorphus CBS 117.55]
MSSNEPAIKAAILIDSLSLRRVVSLLQTLLTIKFLHAVLDVFRVDRTTEEYPNSRIAQTLERKEQHLINILLILVPEELYLPGPISLSHPGGSAGRRCILSNTSSDLLPTTRGSASTNMTLPLMPVPTRVSPMVHLSNCISHRSVDVEIANAAVLGPGTEFEDTGAQRLGHRPLVSDSVYSSVIRRSLSISGPSSISASQRQSLLSGMRLSGLMSEVSAGPVVVDIEKLQRSRSADSYPGKFPISEGLEFSALASAAPRVNQGGSETAVVRASVRPTEV